MDARVSRDKRVRVDGGGESPASHSFLEARAHPYPMVTFNLLKPPPEIKSPNYSDRFVGTLE